LRRIANMNGLVSDRLDLGVLDRVQVLLFRSASLPQIIFSVLGLLEQHRRDARIDVPAELGGQVAPVQQ
jgi:hypothetical protein